MNKQITIDGTEYTIDLEKAKEMGLIRTVYEPKSVGQRFRNKSSIIDDGEWILIATNPGEVNLICLNSGLRAQSNNVSVFDLHHITEEEWSNLCGEDFELID